MYTKEDQEMMNYIEEQHLASIPNLHVENNYSKLIIFLTMQLT